MIEKIAIRFRTFVKQRVLRKYYDARELRLNTIHATCTEVKQNGYSFVVVTDGKVPVILEQCLESIVQVSCDQPYEIILVGPYDKAERYGKIPSGTKLITYQDTKDMPGWISLKKNIGVSAASFENVAVLHDYVKFMPGWLDAMLEYDRGNPHWNVLMNRITFKDGRRARDWLVWDYPDIGVGLLPYEIEATEYQYISGTYFVTKKNFYMKNPQSIKYRWGEGEDIEWSKRIRKLIKFSINPMAEVRFLKEKPINHAPYDSKWINNTRKIYAALGKTYDV